MQMIPRLLHLIMGAILATAALDGSQAPTHAPASSDTDHSDAASHYTQPTQQQEGSALAGHLKAYAHLFLIFYVVPSIGKRMYYGATYLYHRYVQDSVNVAKIAIEEPITQAETYISSLYEMAERNDIDAILLKINSPGGAAGSSQAIFQEIRHIRNVYDKPIIAWVENICASGGYYIASACDHIVASPVAEIGSIGVILPQWHFDACIRAYNITYDTIQSGEYKSAGNMFTPPQPHEYGMLQEVSDAIYEQFTRDVQYARPSLMNRDPHEWANGKIFNGTHALDHGLIDAVGSRRTAEDALREATRRYGEVVYVIPHIETSISQRLFKTTLSVADHVMHRLHGTCAPHT